MVVQRFKMDKKRLPMSFDELTRSVSLENEAYLKVIPMDPWGKPYEFRTEGTKKFFIRTVGPDGIADTVDDLSREDG
jgi:hypothetical protein